MVFNCWIAALFLLLDPVYSYHQSTQAGRNCCKMFLISPLPPQHYRQVKSYQQIPAHGKCPPLIQFKSEKGHTFCAIQRIARPLMEAIDARQIGPTKDVPSVGAQKGSKTTHPPSSPGESTHPHGTGMSTPLTKAPQGQDTSTTPPSVPPSPPSTDTHRHGSVQNSSSTAVSVPGLQGLDRITMPPSVPSSPPSTNAQGHDSVQMSSSSTQAVPGLQGLDRITMPPSVPSSPLSTNAQGHDSVQMSSSSTQALPGLQGLSGITMPPSVPPSLPSTDAQGHDSLQMSSSSTQVLPGLQGLDRSHMTSSVPSSPPSVDAHGYDNPKTSSSSTQAPPGLRGPDSRRTPASVSSSPVATASQGSAGSQMPISSATALPGPQSQGATSTLQTTQALPSTEEPPQEDITTAQLMKATEMTSPHPKNNIAAAVTTAPNYQLYLQSKTEGHININTAYVISRDWESRGERLHIGLVLAIFLIAAVAIALLHVKRGWRANWLVPEEERDSTRRRHSDTVDLLRYQNADSNLV